MTVAEWPVVDRRRLVLAYRPGGGASAEAPFRTLRTHRWASSGVRVTRRLGQHLAGQVTLFSALNVDSARLARLGNLTEAATVAGAAATLENGQEFTELQRVMSSLPDSEARQVVEGVLPDGAPPDLADALRDVARRTEEWRAAHREFLELADVVIGQVEEVREGHVLLRLLDGPATAVPRWMAVAANRDEVGALLAIITDKLSDGRAIIEAVPAIDLGNSVHRYRPFGRSDPSILRITDEDARKLQGRPAPLRIIVPVDIED